MIELESRCSNSVVLWSIGWLSRYTKNLTMTSGELIEDKNNSLNHLLDITVKDCKPTHFLQILILDTPRIKKQNGHTWWFILVCKCPPFNWDGRWTLLGIPLVTYHHLPDVLMSFSCAYLDHWCCSLVSFDRFPVLLGIISPNGMFHGLLAQHQQFSALSGLVPREIWCWTGSVETYPDQNEPPTSTVR